MSIAEKYTTLISEKIPQVYQKGFSDGQSQGGGGADEFWDEVQQNGSRTDFTFGFAGKSWTDNTFKPKHPIRPTLASYMFAQSGITDLRNFNIDFSKNTSFTYTFQGSSIQYLGVIDTTSCSNLNYIFNNTGSLKSVEFIILKSDGSQTWGNASINNSPNLERFIIISGYIGKQGFDISKSTKLDKESIISIVNALSTSTSGLSITLSKTAVENAFAGTYQEKTFENVIKWNMDRDGSYYGGFVPMVDGRIISTSIEDSSEEIASKYSGDWLDDKGNKVTVDGSFVNPIGENVYILTYEDETKIPQNIIETYNSIPPTTTSLTFYRTVETPLYTLEEDPEWQKLVSSKLNWTINLV